MDLLPKIIEDYVGQHTAVEPDYLYELNRETHLNVLRPRMLSGHVQGRFLSFISKLISPKLIVELGTYTGYSALCLAEGLRSDGQLISIDSNEELHDIQEKYFSKSLFKNQINTVVADAMEHISQLPDNIDLVFIDADKENYLNYYQLLFPKMRVGGILIADNVLWSGKVTKPSEDLDEETKSLVDFNEFVQHDVRAENFLLAIRDGLMLIRKIKDD